MRAAFITGFSVFLISATAGAGELRAKVSVSRFDQEVHHYYDNCHGWEFTEQNQLKTELESGLSERGLRVLERNKDSARYEVTGAITELGICEEEEGSALQLGGIVSLLGGPVSDLSLGKRSATSKIKLKANLVLIKTGEILKSFEARSEISGGGYAIEASTLGIGAGHHARNRAPMERASNEAIRDLSTQIASFIQERD